MITVRQRLAIRTFVSEMAREDGGLHIRDPLVKIDRKIHGRYATEIKTKKHTLLAFYCDSLGNTVCLEADGTVRQLIGNEADHLWP